MHSWPQMIAYPIARDLQARPWLHIALKPLEPVVAIGLSRKIGRGVLGLRISPVIHGCAGDIEAAWSYEGKKLMLIASERGLVAIIFPICLAEPIREDLVDLPYRLPILIKRERGARAARAAGVHGIEALIAGRGIKCEVDGKRLLCGNARLMEDNGVAFAPADTSSTAIYVALDGAYVGVIEVDDRIKEGAKEALEELRALGIKRTVMLTGDLGGRARPVAEELGIDECAAELLPDSKLKRAEELKADGGLIYVGDGINDAPVMTVADCAVSMGKVGSDAAIEASDIVLVSDSLALLPKGRRIARGTRSIVFQNIVGSLVIKFAIMLLSVILPGFPLIVAIFGDVGVMLLAILNAMRTSLLK